MRSFLYRGHTLEVGARPSTDGTRWSPTLVIRWTPLDTGREVHVVFDLSTTTFATGREAEAAALEHGRVWAYRRVKDHTARWTSPPSST